LVRNSYAGIAQRASIARESLRLFKWNKTGHSIVMSVEGLRRIMAITQMKTSEMKETNCPVCKLTLDRATAVSTDASPNEGDLTVCLGCGTRHRYTAEFDLVPLTRDELNEMKEKEPAEFEELFKIQMAIIENLK
jgi:RNase P subunit RPR2